MTASFLEIYGEDVYDLLEDSTAAADASCRRTSLPIREDAAQGVIVQGLKQVPVASRGEALQVLRKGTTNRCVVSLIFQFFLGWFWWLSADRQETRPARTTTTGRRPPRS